MSSLTHLDWGRVAVGSVAGFLTGVGVAFFRPPLAPFVGAAVAGLRLDSRLDEYGIGAFVGGAVGRRISAPGA